MLMPAYKSGVVRFNCAACYRRSSGNSLSRQVYALRARRLKLLRSFSLRLEQQQHVYGLAAHSHRLRKASLLSTYLSGF